MNKIVISFDVDWAPEEVIHYTLSVLQEYNAPATFFATHASALLQSVDPSLFEIGIHPNFNALLNNSSTKNYQEVINDLHALYPSAKGARSHSLTQSADILSGYIRSGIIYDANIFLPYQSITPYRHCNNLYRIPFNWEDDVHYLYGKRFDQLGLPLDTPGLKIFNFHPVHVFLNTDSESTYSNAKMHYQDAFRLWDKRNTAVPGAEDALRRVLDHGTKHNQLCRLIDTIEDGQ